MRSIALITLAIVVTLVSALATATPRTAAATPQAHTHDKPVPDIRKSSAARFVGEWKGTAVHHAPGQAEPSTVDMIETVQWKLGETALLIEGRGVMNDKDTGEEKVVHEAMAVVRIDPRSHKLMFHAFKVGEPSNVSELEVLDNGDMRWFIQPAPNAMVRFTIHLTDDTWTEIGEFSRDGGVTYHPFMEMNLKRVK